MEIITKSAEETKDFGKETGNKLKGGEIFALMGDLGSGKTTFAQGLIRGLGIKKRIISPTFILVRHYEVLSTLKFGRIKNIYHIDLYRLEGSIGEQLSELGFSDIISDDSNVVLVEWADKATNVFPSNTVWIEFKNVGKDKRKIIVRKKR